MKPTQAIILCGGKGTRLGERVRDLPKPMLPVGSRPVLDHIMDTLQSAGVNRFILSAGYLGEKITEYYRDNPRPGCSVEVIMERTPQGTAGAVRIVGEKLDHDFVLAYGDVYTDFDLRTMVAIHEAAHPLGTLLVRASDHPWDSHLIDCDIDGRVREFIHEREPGRLYRNVANAAFYILSKKILDFIPIDRPSDFGVDVFPKILREGGNLLSYTLPEEGFVKDMGTPERLAAVEQYLQERTLARTAATSPRKVSTVLLDRDGVLNLDSDLIDRAERLQLLPGAASAVAMLNHAGIRCHVITNQPVIARGLCTEDTLDLIHARLRQEIGNAQGKLESIYYCPHHPETHHPGGRVELRRSCRCRKPSPGLIFRAQREHGFDLAETVIVGDRSIDLRAGRAAGIRTVLIGMPGENRTSNESEEADARFPSLLAFAKALVANEVFQE